MRRLKLKNFTLTLVLFILFLISVLGQIAAGFHAHNEELIQNNHPPLIYWSEYLGSGHFISSLSEKYGIRISSIDFFCLFERKRADFIL